MDGTCPVINERDEGKWSIRLFSPYYNFGEDWPPGDYLLSINKYITYGKAPYVHPLIIENFVGSVSDKGVIIQSGDLLNAQSSNR